MDPATLLQHLRDELAAFRVCLDGDLSLGVEHCGSWTLRDLAEHLGTSNLWAAAAVTERRCDDEPPSAARAPEELLPWFDETARTLLKALDTDPATPAWTFHPPHTVGFWQRRRCVEALVHRWDAERALGTPHPLDPHLAGEGVAEVFDTMAPRQVARGRTHPPAQALRLLATDTGAGWTYGPGDPVATLAAPAEHLLLLLWGRAPHTGEAVTWTGDQEAGLALLRGPLTP
ncbi:maleylpyruvate isomerase family mycothiol-dependent enzyme [Streptomyces sp. NPDC096205]|uniref:maleylpyruvate isomerase family mycothiol-dependent enzyme n=1 Tax=Streptomyces sp. NPDC096205 TaxID=3366081 RepID=UPI0038201388